MFDQDLINQLLAARQANVPQTLNPVSMPAQMPNGTTLAQLFQQSPGYFQGQMGPMPAPVQQWANQFQGNAQNAFGGIKQGLQDAYGRLPQPMQDRFNQMRQNWQQAPQNMQNRFNQIGQGLGQINNGMNQWHQGIGQARQDFRQGMQGFGQRMMPNSQGPMPQRSTGFNAGPMPRMNGMGKMNRGGM